MNERFVRVGDVELCYESLGDPAHPTVLLVMGLNLSMDRWRDDFCADLAGRGFHVVRFDNRDVGRSTHVGGPGISAWQFLRRRATPVYTLGDMADDAAGLVAHVDPHVVGASLGSMVAQEVAIRHPHLTRSLVSIMGRPGDGRTGKVHWTRVPDFLRPPAADPVEGMVAAFRRIGSDGRTAQDDREPPGSHTPPGARTHLRPCVRAPEPVCEPRGSVSSAGPPTAAPPARPRGAPGRAAPAATGCPAG
ncbi:alpha/beta fold hydrolase [Pseudonocardia sp. KRD-184]|uniref:Alpha/beta fold hydrolase n=1 Tax=Pseudonocardia oceani TaxID=2792013 RepID=A0ABS6U542_9PSEU|nr:alpha/beta hydrolase [Pseudonocardia oceani]MBW0092608.1 alpha/beta fold hydrolase [Pseudonocardia oceani]MBW0099438.1 alpha/beta fold hydrolase [Pseudonocardia oceani]MBW0124971.1 alpha/beta fold hydrolase [Pseudonocardia oceani]MBW0127358.1 alpha/beta fold hydrolase [Pseudonocardia oceani]